MEKQKISLVENNTANFGNYTRGEFLKVYYEYPPEAIKDLARRELENVKYFVTIELDSSNYWKLKEKTLINIINE
jgi:hypothetical protein